ncbi:DUF4350 domain-containing protein [Ascidiimonas aurantiaca]|uniref:DUF4350 domain-containing protein n=1 Tax=Ascidiimonas aurantiaca TaxID=1685432 RepID=UPI0030ECC549
MGKKGKTYIAIAGLLLALFIVLEYNKPRKINWFPSYDRSHKIPMGTRVFNEQLNVMYRDQVKNIRKPPYQFLKQQPDAKGIYVFANQTLVLGEEEFTTLIEWVAKGNTLWVAANTIEEKLMDTLGIESKKVTNYATLKADYRLVLSNPVFKNIPEAVYDRGTTVSYFKAKKESDSSEIRSLGKIVINADSSSYKNIIQSSFGNGKIILSHFPEAFTNYFILKEPNDQYTSGLLSYFQDYPTIYIDNYYKAGKKIYSSPLYLLLSTRELKWAYYITLIALLIFIIFEGKRKQRSIPVLVPLKNQSLSFVKTIANMYFEKKEHKAIATYRIKYFFESLRRKSMLNYAETDEKVLQIAAEKMGKSQETAKNLFNKISEIRDKPKITKEELLELNVMIETFNE